jgi:hypothetical protein
MSPNLEKRLNLLALFTIHLIDNPRLDNMQIRQPRLPKPTNQVQELRHRISHLHPLPRIPGTNPETHAVRTNSINKSLSKFNTKPRPVLNAPTLLIRPLVAHTLEELIHQVPTCAVDLNTVKPRRNGIFGGGCKVPDKTLDLFPRSGLWEQVRRPPWRLSENSRVGSTTKGN